jgi:hypothetical protein
MRAILIDPEKRTVSEIQHRGGGYRETNRILGCNEHTLRAWLNGSMSEGFDAVFVSDDPLEDRDDPRFWFQVDADRDPPSSFPIAGLGLALGTDQEGESCNVRISVEELAKRITFTQRKFRGFTVERGVEGDTGLLKIDADAPIIDGTDEGKGKIERPESWNAKMLSGAPLITDEQFERLLANYPPNFRVGAPLGDVDPVPVVKIFLPHVRWLLVWIYPNNRDLALAAAKWGNERPVVVDVRLSHIVRSRLGSLMPERDKYIRLDRPLSHYLLHHTDW